MNEITCSIHNYTKFSGFSYSFYDMAQAALDCGLDAVFTSDKNIYPSGRDQFYYRSEKSLLVVCGEELYNPLSEADPHYLSLGIAREQFNRKVSNAQEDIRIITDINQENHLFRHIELINAEDLLLGGISSGLKSIREKIISYDEKLKSEQRFIAIAGTCSSNHTEKYSYRELFSTIKNHIFSDEEMNGDLIHDKLLLLKNIKSGHLYIGFDGFADTSGFSFNAEGNNQNSIAWPGDIIYLQNSITLKISIPERCLCRLIRNGSVIREWQQCRQVPFTIYEPGYYRVECFLPIHRNLYNWIFSNPIFVIKG